MSYWFNTTNKKNRRLVYDKFDGHCAYCGCELDESKFQIDHMNPLRRKEENVERDYTFENCFPCCVQCNCSKSSFHIEQWRNELEAKIERLNKHHSIYRICKSFGLVRETGNRIIFYFERYGA